jgi:hypothetical protein
VNPHIASRLYASLGLLALALPATTANAAPAQLLNKTVFISFSVAVPAKGADGSTLSGARNSQRVIYISSAGRVFARASRQAGRSSETKEAGPEATTVRIAGNSLVGVMKYPSGASQLTVSFDPSFQSCTAQILTGGESGKPIVFKGLNGVMYTATGKMQFSGISCSIKDGNALAD